MLFGMGLRKSRGREISSKEKAFYYKREAIQTDGNEICGALEVLTERKETVVCDDYFYTMLENSYANHRRKLRQNWLPIYVAGAFCTYAIVNIMKRFSERERSASWGNLLFLFIAVMLLVYMIFRKKKSADRLKRVRECIRERDHITAYQIRIDELVWYDNSDSESTDYVPYLLGQNILFRVTDDIFNNVCPGEYFTAAIVNTGMEKMFFLL